MAEILTGLLTRKPEPLTMLIAIGLLANGSDAPCISCKGFTGLRSTIRLFNGDRNPITVELDTSETAKALVFLCAVCAANVAGTINAQLSLLRQEHESRKI